MILFASKNISFCTGEMRCKLAASPEPRKVELANRLARCNERKKSGPEDGVWSTKRESNKVLQFPLSLRYPLLLYVGAQLNESVKPR